MAERGWGRRFEDPIEVDHRELVTLHDAGEYVAALSKACMLPRNGKRRWKP
ncbi:hypothetical protein Q3C01_09170 [Bradyrhizobium sp. UFLA05-109]